MNILAPLFLIIFLIGVIISVICGAVKGFLSFLRIFLWFLIPALIVWLLNLFMFPGKESRYVPDVQISTSAAVNFYNWVDRSNLTVGEPFYLQVKIKVDSASFARRFLNDNKIPFKVEISNPELASFIVERSRGFEEYKEPEFENNRTVYFFNVFAKKPDEISEINDDEYAIINLRGEAEMPGIQQVKIIFDKKVSGTYSKIISFEYR